MEQNNLYPIFLKAKSLQFLIVGGGNVALEKLTFLIKSSPDAKIQIVAPEFKHEIIDMAQFHDIEIINERYRIDHLRGKQIVVVATNQDNVNKRVYRDCKSENILVNLADQPSFCDFYMGGIVTKGNVKIAISTNGKSPTMAKRMRQFLEDVIPENINDLVENLNTYRKTLKGNFESKVLELNELTKSIIKN